MIKYQGDLIFGNLITSFFINEPLEDAFCDVSKYVQVYVKKSGFDITPILNKLEKQKEKLEKEKSKLNGMLNNKNFVANAPKDVLEKNNALLEEVEGNLQNINDELERIK